MMENIKKQYLNEDYLVPLFLKASMGAVVALSGILIWSYMYV